MSEMILGLLEDTVDMVPVEVDNKQMVRSILKDCMEIALIKRDKFIQTVEEYRMIWVGEGREKAPIQKLAKMGGISAISQLFTLSAKSGLKLTSQGLKGRRINFTQSDTNSS